jgi:hypothetical protein
MVRYPLGGMLCGSLQWLVAFQRLGHEVYFVEKSGWSNSCYDPTRDVMTDDCAYGTSILHGLLGQFGLEERWCFVDADGEYHGLSRRRVEQILNSADLFVDCGTHGAWLPEAQGTRLRVLIDGEPGYTQMRMEKQIAEGQALPSYDQYYTVGQNIGTPKSAAPTAGKTWRTVFHPVLLDLFEAACPDPKAAFSTVMNWQSHELLEFMGATYGQKDVEFLKFIDLPSHTHIPMELAVAGKKIPRDRLLASGWRLRDAHEVTTTLGSFLEYIRSSAGEFSVCKQVFVATNSGWFSDRSAAYLASGRPVVMQDTGFSEHLPCGQGLFAVHTVDEAATAIEAIAVDYERHSRWARDVALEHLEATRVVGRFLHELGID